jgi:hypothetical protein
VTVEEACVPNLISLKGCYLGWQDSLDKLRKLVEPEINQCG